MGRRRLQRPKWPPNPRPQRQPKMMILLRKRGKRKTMMMLMNLALMNHLRRGKSSTKVVRVKAKTRVREKVRARIRAKAKAKIRAKARERIKERARARKARVNFKHSEEVILPDCLQLRCICLSYH